MISFKRFLEESASRSLSRMMHHMQSRPMGIISASLKTNDARTNNQNHKKLEHSIKKAGFGYVKKHGQYVGAHGVEKEKSFVVMGKHKGDDKGKLLKFLKKHGTKHNQESILYKHHDKEQAQLHYTKDIPERKIKRGHSEEIGKFHPNHENPYGHTVMSKGGGKAGRTPAAKKTFAFE